MYLLHLLPFIRMLLSFQSLLQLLCRSYRFRSLAKNSAINSSYLKFFLCFSENLCEEWQNSSEPSYSSIISLPRQEFLINGDCKLEDMLFFHSGVSLIAYHYIYIASLLLSDLGSSWFPSDSRFQSQIRMKFQLHLLTLLLFPNCFL